MKIIISHKENKIEKLKKYLLKISDSLYKDISEDINEIIKIINELLTTIKIKPIEELDFS